MDKNDNFVPSKYNLAIFDYAKNGVGNMVVGASAGSGKTRTLIEIINLLNEDSKVMVCSFNREIVNELKKRIDKKNVYINTAHSIGRSILFRTFGKLELDAFKYRVMITKNISKFNLKISKNEAKRNEYINNVAKLVDFARNYLVSTKEEIEELAMLHDIDIIDNEVESVIKVLEWGHNVDKTIDFIDMIWLPNVLGLSNKTFQYDYVLVDECQDLSNAQRELILKCKHLGTRFFFFGDKNQCLYAFSSASPEAFDYLCNMPNTVLLPLSISYRCPKNIVKFAQKIVPSIEYSDKSEDGEVNFKCDIDMINNGDMVLCRANAPLMHLYSKLVEKGKIPIIRGNDIGNNLIEIIKKTKTDNLGCDLKSDGLISRLYKKLFEEIDNLQVNKGFSEQQALNTDLIKNRLDSIKTIEILSKTVNNVDELIKKITKIFTDVLNDNNVIYLSTIHKAKGLESDNVFILPFNGLANETNMVDWQIEQENNIKYVAYTRSKKTLNFIDSSTINDDDNDTNNLTKIKTLVNRIYLTNFGISNDDFIKLLNKDKKSVKTSKIKPIVERESNSKIGFKKEKTNELSLKNKKVKRNGR